MLVTLMAMRKKKLICCQRYVAGRAIGGQSYQLRHVCLYVMKVYATLAASGLVGVVIK